MACVFGACFCAHAPAAFRFTPLACSPLSLVSSFRVFSSPSPFCLRLWKCSEETADSEPSLKELDCALGDRSDNEMVGGRKTNFLTRERKRKGESRANVVNENRSDKKRETIPHLYSAPWFELMRYGGLLTPLVSSIQRGIGRNIVILSSVTDSFPVFGQFQCWTWQCGCACWKMAPVEGHLELLQHYWRQLLVMFSVYLWMCVCVGSMYEQEKWVKVRMKTSKRCLDLVRRKLPLVRPLHL